MPWHGALPHLSTVHCMPRHRHPRTHALHCKPHYATQPTTAPTPQARMEILKIHAFNITKHGDIDYEGVVKLADGFNGADLRNICTEAGMFAIRDERDYVTQVGCWVSGWRRVQQQQDVVGGLQPGRIG